MRVIWIIVLILSLVTLGGVGYYLYALRQSQGSVVGPFQNPFSQPTTSFGASSPSPVNPFASPTPTTYQNPFSTRSQGGQPYQNPFEKLR